MSLPSLAAPMKAADDVHYLSRFLTFLGISVSELDYLRGHEDDFMGHTLDTVSRYTTAISGAGSAAFVSYTATVPAGWIAGSAGAGAGRYSRLWLGNAVDGFPCLDADLGWLAMIRWQCNSVTSLSFWFGAAYSGFTRYLLAGYDSTAGANWLIASNDGGASSSAAALGPAINTKYWLALEASSGLAKLYLNGSPIITKTTNIPTEILTPVLYIQSSGGAGMLAVDYWANKSRHT